MKAVIVHTTEVAINLNFARVIGESGFENLWFYTSSVASMSRYCHLLNICINLEILNHGNRQQTSDGTSC